MTTRIISLTLATALFAAIVNLLRGQPPAKIAVTTYHCDNLRTGWNSHETILNASLTKPGSGPFQRTSVVRLDDNVYAQPLVVPDIAIKGTRRDAVYVATENNTVYAIDGDSGAILLSPHLAAPVPRTNSNCANNGPELGIESTPVIDLASQTLYAMSYQIRSGHPAYVLYALDLATLATKRSVIVAATHKLTNGSDFAFDPSAQRQRAALLLEDGNVYAAFASFCDHNQNSRGWLLGWRASDLKPLSANILVNRAPNAYLSSIWMSGYGLAAIAGHIYFTTGNSEPSGQFTYNNPNNLSESVVKVSADLTQALDFFTPLNVALLDTKDLDLGSGGVMIVPDQAGPVPRMAVAAGKSGQMFLLNRTGLGGFDGKINHVVGTYTIGSCFCGPSYYLGKIVSSGGSDLKVWQIDTTPSANLSLLHSGTLNGDGFGTDGDGFFTAVSSNGASDALIWAVSQRDNTNPPHFPRLFAFRPVTGNAQLQPVVNSMVAGRWDFPTLPGDGAHSNIVPVVANGHVYVASYTELDIFGFGPPVIQ
jgi:outer membrane protein assembly factor BamB